MLEQIEIPAPKPDRLVLIDALRAIALFGVILVNMLGITFVIAAAKVAQTATTADFGVMIFEAIFIFGKARAAFAFLFGLGFGMILQKAAKTGRNFQAIFARRLVVLLCFGLINQIFLFFGDILLNYALLGFALMLTVRWSDRALLRTGLALIVLPPLAFGIAQIIIGGPLPNLAGEPLATLSAATAARGMAAHESGSYLEMIGFLASFPVHNLIANPAHRIEYNLALLGMFMLGSFAARHGLLLNVDQHRELLRKTVKWLLPTGLVLSMIYAASILGLKLEGPLAGLVAACFSGPSILALGYIAALALLFSARAKAFQAIVAPAGGMALTNYLASGAIGSIYFYGYGFGRLGELGIAGINIFAVTLFSVLLLASHIWLSMFRMGPVEWIWRSLIEGKGQPMLRSHRTARSASAG